MNRTSDALKTLSELIKIPSVEGAPECGAPFGRENLRALNYMLSVCSNLGFRTVSGDGYYGYAEIGDSDKPLFGVLTHLDVVPVSEGWSHHPFGGVIDGGYLWGRGALDDKGPAVAAVYACRELLDEGLKPSKRIRFIFGSNEESGWRCIEKYLENEEIPSLAFSPDADFPVIYCEKAVSHVGALFPLPSGIADFKAGTRVNIVPDLAECVLESDALSASPEALPEGVTRTENGFKAVGKAAHGSSPSAGDNAAVKLLKFISSFIPSAKKLYDICAFSDGYGMGLKASAPDYGALTVNPGVFRVENGKIAVSFDFRHPASVTTEDIVKRLGELGGAEIYVSGKHRPLLMPKDHPLVAALTEAYREVTGDNAEPVSIGGATYARALPAAVAFGPVFPGEESNIHQTDERVSLDSFEKTMKIYKAALKKLCFTE